MKDYDFRWIHWNAEHIGEHGVSPGEAEYVVRHEQPPWPRREGPNEFRSRGQTARGVWLQVVYVVDEDGRLFVIHARPLTQREKQQCRRSHR